MCADEAEAALEKMHADLRAARFDDVIRHYEDCLAAIEPPTALHCLIGRSFMGQLEEAVRWLTAAYDDAARQFRVTVVDVEMCRFEINTDAWLLWAFAFDTPEQEAFEDLGCYRYDSEPFQLTGVEDIQAAMGEMNDEYFDLPEDQQDAFSLAWELVLVQMLKLMAAAYESAKAVGHPLGRVPFFAGVHDHQAVYDAERGTVEFCQSAGVLDYRLTEEGEG